MKKKYIVTGGAGFIGSHLTQRLLNEGHSVIVLDNFSTGYRSFLPTHENLEIIEVDISNWDSLSRIFPSVVDVDGVFHFAACARIQPSIKNPFITHETNTTGTMNVLQLMRVCNIKSIVYSGSSSFYGKNAKLPCKETAKDNCETPYAVSKYVGELYCQTWGRLFGIRNVSLRYFNVYGKRSPLSGPYAPVIGLFFKQALTTEKLTIVGDGEQKRDFTHINDVVEANILAMNALFCPDWGIVNGTVINIGTGENHTINELANMVLDSLAKPVEIVHINPRPGEAKETLADNSKAKSLLGWEPLVDLDDGIEDLKNYFQNKLLELKNGQNDL